jgi:hypothetical protein
MTNENTEKIYCYVDETGQDTKGELFIVSVVVSKEHRNELVKLLEQIEIESGKKSSKWLKTKKQYQIAYLEKIFRDNNFKKSVYYSLAKGTKAYRDTTIVTVASAVNAIKSQDKYKASVFVDGLNRKEVGIVSVGLRRVGLRIEKVRGVTDESNAMIRLADAIAGLARRNYEGNDYAKQLYELGIKKGVIKRL